ncbi:MAG: GNAT family N-acetyltransferase [Betaproteobacteria bacterium]|nr:GNAT family N-acetyltransferase [Betaproteobacteria bacterium]
MNHLVQRLQPAHRKAIARHFSRLDAEALRLRFGHALTRAALREYVARIDFQRDALFGAFDDADRLAGVAHVARLEAAAEVGLSVLRRHRGQGIGRALLGRAATHARAIGLERIELLCLPHNQAMARLAAAAGMTLHTVDGMTQASATLPSATLLSVCEELLSEEWARLDRRIRVETRALRALWHARRETGQGISRRLARAVARPAEPVRES